ncbi:hypothetical protein KC19_4G103900 [Ceratodon purpureus]|uniref:Uncharacterized protein n=1 Tax=Ceratodon purpureus TaxID=3225 RepID=A0A8T0I930_CERPU|nr:hypothetical protein KC19_4G103900 [Ceratodon purpureus]
MAYVIRKYAKWAPVIKMSSNTEAMSFFENLVLELCVRRCARRVTWLNGLAMKVQLSNHGQ